MKKIKKAFAVFLAAVVLLCVNAAVPVYADEESGEARIESIVRKSLNKAEKEMKSIALGAVASVSTYEELVSALENKISNIYILNDIYLEAALNVDYSVSFLADSDTVTLFSGSGFRHIQITASDVRIQFNNVILDGQYDRGIRGGGIETEEGVSDTALTGAIIQNGYYSRRGSAINNNSTTETGSFSLYNSVIKNNMTASHGAVYLMATDVVIYNTLFENNTSNSNGYGILSLDADERTTAVIYDSVFRGNAIGHGGAIYVYETDLFLNKNTIIENNSAKKEGGGIYAEYSSIESYAAINHNSAGNNGGGIALVCSSLVMQDGEISYNSAGMNRTPFNDYGGGVSMKSDQEQTSVMTVNDGIIQGNVSIYGGGISCDVYSELVNSEYQSKLYINGGTISENGYTLDENGTIDKICDEGGGIYVYQVEMTDGVIENNLCSGEGGGIFTDNFLMSGGTIQDNGYYENASGLQVITSFGGGLYAKTATITGGLIYSNMANNGGGIICYTLNLSAPAYIRYNAATNKGGGVYFESNNSGGDVDFSRIRNNTAENGGDQYYFG